MRLSILCGAAMALSALTAGAAYVIFTPRMITAALERRMTSCAAPTATCAPPGAFIHKRSLASPDDRAFVNPNADTLYSSAWLDLRDGPWVLHVPDMGGRYFTFQLLDAWTETFGYVGRRTGDSKGGDFLIVGPNWTGLPPAGMKLHRAGTNDVWILGRTLVDDDADLPKVTALQDRFALQKYVAK
jgi:hypothetical protein